MKKNCLVGYGILLVFAIGLVIELSLFSSCSPVSQAGLSSEIPESVAKAPGSDWRVPVKAAEIEYAELLDTNSLFLTTLRVYGFMQSWGLARNEIILTDIRKGNIRWKKKFRNLSSTAEQVLSADGFFFISGWDYNSWGQRLSALDKQTGKIIWTQIFPRPFLFSYDPGMDVILGAGTDTHADEAPFTITAVNPSTGDSVWETTMPGSFCRESPRICDLYPRDKTLLIVSGGAVHLDAKTGNILWKQELDPTLHKSPKIITTAKHLLISSNDRLDLFSRESGQPLWTYRVSNSTLVDQMFTGDKVFLVAEDSLQKCTLVSLELSDGNVVWKEQIDGTLRSSLYQYGDRIYMSTQDRLITLHAATGELGPETDLPPFMRTEYGLPDYILMENGTVIIAREIGLAAFYKNTLEPRYSHAIPGTDIYTYHFASQRLLMRQLARRSGGNDFDFAGLTREFQNQVIRNNTGVEPQFATGVPRTAVQAQFEVTMAAANMAASVASAGIAFREEAVAENMNINEKEIVAAMGAHALSIQHGYYIRPFYRNGWGLTLVLLEDGSRSDLFVSAPCEPLVINNGNFPMFFIDPETDQLLVNGTGREIHPDNVYEKVGFGKDVFKTWPGIPPKWSVPYSSVFCYNLDKLQFDAPRTRDFPSQPPVLGKKEQKLRSAILNRNTREVKSLIDAGADVNAVDQAGFNALFYAAMTDDKKIARVLIYAGADATVRDYHGLLPYHYTFLNHGDNRSTGIFRTAYLKQMKEK